MGWNTDTHISHCTTDKGMQFRGYWRSAILSHCGKGGVKQRKEQVDPEVSNKWNQLVTTTKPRLSPNTFLQILKKQGLRQKRNQLLSAPKTKTGNTKFMLKILPFNFCTLDASWSEHFKGTLSFWNQYLDLPIWLLASEKPLDKIYISWYVPRRCCSDYSPKTVCSDQYSCLA